MGVVMPVYKQKPEFLKAALESILNQTLRQFRLIIVIDGAPEMEPLIRMFANDDPRVEIVSYPINQGVPHALNTGFDVLFQDPALLYLTWVSSDNIYRPEFLAVLRNSLAKGPETLGLAYSSFQNIDNHNTPLYDEAALAALRQYQGRSKEKLLDSSIVGVSFMYKTVYAKMVQGGYSLAPVEDYDYFLKLTDHCDIRYIPVELMDYRVDSTFSVSSQLKSTEAHRRWRYAFHLSRHLARCRRGIPPEIALLLPLREASPAAVERIEDLYEQTFSNYVCCILDLSPDQQVSTVLCQIAHPTTIFEWHPYQSAASAARISILQRHTPYAMLLDLKKFGYLTDLEILHQQLKKSPPYAFSSCYTPDYTDVGYRTGLLAAPARSNELFYTQALSDLLHQHAAPFGELP
ncbi:glycosyltransferase [Paenibacillus dokdonensis]|uniref:Glycosyltransferase n=1 Tax=Paenibacillus dokdonensis TaxID=2567944 RepID=A0ABU6GMA6_9BACL|nr:glycosyltransferase [Paenibacillus dokdonensis]MEC0240889.1 glycosyltransferase [Paenibacillus dokdonensis]